MREFFITLSEEVVNELQRASLEVNARQGVIDRYLEKHMNDIDSSAIESKPFKYFMSLLAESEAEFELAKNRITKQYIPDVLQQHEIEWNLDYETKILTIKLKCDCDIPDVEKLFREE